MSQPQAPKTPEKNTLRLTGERVSISRGGRLIIDSLDFEARAGEMLILRGANGSGKTSILRAISGFLGLDEGAVAISWRGEQLVQNAERQTATTYCGHLNAIKDALSVMENLNFWADLYGAGKDTRAAALGAFDLGNFAKFKAGALSAGLKRRLSLSRLVLCARPIWLLDEPTTALDAASQETFFHVVREHLDNGGLIVAATHDAIDPEGISTRTIHLGQGGARQ